MRLLFADEDLKQLLTEHKNRRYRKYQLDSRFLAALDRVFAVLMKERDTSMLAQYSFLHYEKLRGVDMSSVRVMNGRVERVLFREVDDGIEIVVLELNTDHYGNR